MIKNGLYNVVGAVIRMGLTVLTIPLLIRLIGVEEYGLWTLTSATVGIVSLAEGGLSVSTTVFLSKDLANDDADSASQTLTVTVGTMLLLATMAVIVLWVGAPRLIGLFPLLEQRQYLAAVQALQVGGLVIWAQLLQRVLIGVEQAHQQYGVINVLNTLQITLSHLGMLIVAWLGGRTTELMQWQAVVSVGVLIVHGWVGWLLLRHFKIHLAWNNTKGMDIAKYSLMTWLASLGSALFNKADRILVGASLGTGLLGVYAAITNVTVQINSFSAVAIQPVLPAISNHLARKEFDLLTLQRQVKQALEINSIIALGLGAGLLALAPQIIQVVIPGQSPRNYLSEFNTATIIYSLYSVNAVGYYVLLAVKAVNKFMVIQLASGIISLALITIGLHSFGLLGAIVGNVGYLGVFLLTFLGMKNLNIPLRLWLDWLKFPLAWFLSVIVIFISANYRIGVSYKIFILFLQFVVILNWLKSTQNMDFQSLIRQLTKKNKC